MCWTWVPPPSRAHLNSVRCRAAKIKRNSNSFDANFATVVFASLIAMQKTTDVRVLRRKIEDIGRYRPASERDGSSRLKFASFCTLGGVTRCPRRFGFTSKYSCRRRGERLKPCVSTENGPWGSVWTWLVTRSVMRTKTMTHRRKKRIYSGRKMVLSFRLTCRSNFWLPRSLLGTH